MQYRHVHKGTKAGNDAAISSKNLVNCVAVTTEITFVWLLDKNWLMIYIRRAGISLRVGWLIISIATFKAAMEVYISYKFGGLLSSTSVVDAAQLDTAGIDQHSG